MYLAGAELNYFEYFHKDLLNTHKLFLDALNNNEKIFRIGHNYFNNRKPSYMTEINEDIYFRKESVKNLKQLNTHCSVPKRAYTTHNSNTVEDNGMIFNNNNSDIFIQSILCDENLFNKIQKNDLLFRLNRVLENIREKLMIDSIIRPLKIFWVKADYMLVGKIVAIIGTGVGLIASILFKGINLGDILSN
jgi:hypothetical protein